MCRKPPMCWSSIKFLSVCSCAFLFANPSVLVFKMWWVFFDYFLSLIWFDLIWFDLICSFIATTAATGLLGMMGNKGGAAIRFKLMDNSICFVCSHLAAHRENVAGRNADFHKYVWFHLLTFQDLWPHSFQEGRRRRRRFWHYEPRFDFLGIFEMLNNLIVDWRSELPYYLRYSHFEGFRICCRWLWILDKERSSTFFHFFPLLNFPPLLSFEFPSTSLFWISLHFSLLNLPLPFSHIPS